MCETTAAWSGKLEPSGANSDLATDTEDGSGVGALSKSSEDPDALNPGAHASGDLGVNVLISGTGDSQVCCKMLWV